VTDDEAEASLERLRVGAHELTFSLTYQSYEMAHPVWREYEKENPQPVVPGGLSRQDELPDEWDQLDRWEEAAGVAYKHELERALESYTGYKGWVSRPVRPGEAAGPGGEELWFILVPTAIAGGIVTWVTIAGYMWKGYQYLKERSRQPVEISDGVAWLNASRAVFEATGNTALSFAFSTPLNPHPPEEDGEPDGYLVGFRSDDRLWTVPVSLQGEILGIAEQDLRSDLPTWWRREEELEEHED
jgi:hypothetical protein